MNLAVDMLDFELYFGFIKEYIMHYIYLTRTMTAYWPPMLSLIAPLIESLPQT